MHIQKEAGNRFMVELTAPELQQFHLTYNQLNLQNTKTKVLLQSLISNAGKMVGFRKGEGKLLIEVYPAPEQGCLIYFTNLHPDGKRYRKIAPYIFRFETCGDLLQGALLFSSPPQSEVYRLKNQYFLVLHGAPVHGLTEFAAPVPCNKTLLAHIREHGQLLGKPNAVERLQGHCLPLEGKVAGRSPDG